MAECVKWPRACVLIAAQQASADFITYLPCRRCGCLSYKGPKPYKAPKGLKRVILWSYCGCMKCLNAESPQPMNPFFHNWALPFLSDLIGHPPLPCTLCCCHGNNFPFFFWILFGWLDLCCSCFPPRNYLPVSLQRLAGVAVSLWHLP